MNSASEPPVNIGFKTGDRITFADVAMRVARDGPMYGVIILVGILAISAKATANESIMGCALALLARSWPNAIQTPVPSRNSHGGMMSMILPALIAMGYMGSITACHR